MILSRARQHHAIPRYWPRALSDECALAGGVQDTLVQHNSPEPAAALVVAPGLIVMAIRRRRRTA